MAGGLAAASQHGEPWAATSCSARAAPISAAASRFACNKRKPGSGCAAQRRHRPRPCVARRKRCLHRRLSRRLAIALVAFDAKIDVLGPNGQRTIAVEELHREPGATPHIETTLAARGIDPAYSRAQDGDGPRFDLSQDPRPGILRLRARLGGGGPGHGWRHRAATCASPSAGSPRVPGGPVRRSRCWSASRSRREAARAAGDAALQGRKARPRQRLPHRTGRAHRRRRPDDRQAKGLTHERHAISRHSARRCL